MRQSWNRILIPEIEEIIAGLWHREIHRPISHTQLLIIIMIIIIQIWMQYHEFCVWNHGVFVPIVLCVWVFLRPFFFLLLLFFFLLFLCCNRGRPLSIPRSIPAVNPSWLWPAVSMFWGNRCQRCSRCYPTKLESHRRSSVWFYFKSATKNEYFELKIMIVIILIMKQKCNEEGNATRWLGGGAKWHRVSPFASTSTNYLNLVDQVLCCAMPRHQQKFQLD